MAKAGRPTTARRSLMCEALEFRRLLAADAVSPVGPMLAVTGDHYAEAMARSSVATAADGTLLVAWAQRDLEGSNGVDVHARRYAADGPAGDAFIVNTTTTGGQSTPVTAALAGGGFVVAWGSSGNGLWFQRYDANAARIGGETRADPGLGFGPSIAATPGGGFILTWVEAHPTVPSTFVCRAASSTPRASAGRCADARGGERSRQRRRWPAGRRRRRRRIVRRHLDGHRDRRRHLCPRI